MSTAWGQDYYCDLYHGSPVYDKKKMELAWYRYHLPDPIYFHEEIQVDIQQIGGIDTDDYPHIATFLYNQIKHGHKIMSVDGH